MTLRSWILVALDAVPWSRYISALEQRDAALGEIVALEDKLAQATEAYESLRSLWLPEDEIPTVVGMQPMVEEEVVR